jgi:hypothetical protein
MKVNAILFLIIALFFWLADIAYIVWSIIAPPHPYENWYDGIEWVGAVAVGLSGILAAFLAFYLARVYAGQGGELPEDRGDALIDDGDAEQGFFSPWSWWPVMLGGALALMFLGFAVGIWITFIGGAVLLVSMLGWQYEYYRGNFAH